MAITKSNTRIKDIIGLLSTGGGAALSNTFKVTFEAGPKIGSESSSKIFTNLTKIFPGFNVTELEGDKIGSSPASMISMFCDEAVLPGMQASTGQINGIYTGSGVFNYPHTRLVNDLTLSWICDANMTPLKFLQVWMDTIFVDYDEGGKEYPIENQKNSGDLSMVRRRNRSTRLNFPDEYSLQLSILKAERGNTSETGRPSIRYIFDNTYPYSIDSTPISFGVSQLVKVSANFYYDRYQTLYTNQWGKASSTYNS